MPATGQTYRRLPGTGFRRIVPNWAIVLLFFVIGIFVLLLRGRRVRLWEGPEHLLQVEWDGYREYYKRFNYRDIQAIVLRRTADGLIFNILMTVAWGLFVVFAALASDPIARGVLIGIAVFFGLMLGINLLFGPTCQCHLRTAVQTEELFSLNRARRARKVLERIRPLIVQAQGQLSPEELELKLAATPPMTESPDLSRPPVIRTPQPLRHYDGTAHQVFFWLMLADLPATLLAISFKSGWIDALGVLLLVVTLGFGIASIVKQHHSDLPAGLKRIPWIALACNGLWLIAGMGYGIYLVVTNPDELATLQNLSPTEDPFVLVMSLVSTAVSVVLGMAGLSLLRKFRASSSATSPPPPPVADQLVS